MKNFYKIVGIGVVLIFLQSCLVTKHYEAPEVVQEKQFRTDTLQQTDMGQDSSTMADLSWKEIFKDPLLQKHINTALTNNINIKIALQQIIAAEAYLKQGKAAYFPSLSAGAQYSLNYPSKNGQQGATIEATGKDHFDLFELAGNISWEADIWGKITSQKRAMMASYLQTVAAQKAVRTRLIASVASTYYQILAVDAQISVTKQTLKTRETSLETTKALKEAGLGNITSTAVQQTKAQYLDAKALLIDLHTQSRLLENTMSLLMGDMPHHIERSDLKNQKITTDLKIGVPIQLLANRPDVIAAENNYRYAFEMTNVAETNFYPSLTISASGGLQSMQLDNWFSVNSLFANLIGGLAGPIFNARQIRTQFEVAQVQQEQARLNLKGVLLQASKEVSDALYNYQASSQKINIKEEEHQLLEQAVKDSQSLLSSGFNNFSYLEVLSAQQNALNASLSVINAKVTQLNSMVDLYEALGGGWQ